MINLMFVSSNEPGFCYLIKDLKYSRVSKLSRFLKKRLGLCKWSKLAFGFDNIQRGGLFDI